MNFCNWHLSYTISFCFFHHTLVRLFDTVKIQKGFPERFRMDYNSGLQDEIEAKFLGRALVRGYRSYLDVMQKDWRQYTPVS